MRNAKKVLSLCMLGILLAATASQLKAFGFGVGFGGRRGGFSVGVGAGPYWDDYPYDYVGVEPYWCPYHGTSHSYSCPHFHGRYRYGRGHRRHGHRGPHGKWHARGRAGGRIRGRGRRV